VVGDRGEHRADGQPRQIGAKTEVRAAAPEADVRIGIAQDVERVGVGEDIFVEIG
jgi:hypothetical protein